MNKFNIILADLLDTSMNNIYLSSGLFTTKPHGEFPLGEWE